MYVPQQWPKWVDLPNGEKFIARDHIHARQLTDQNWQEDGTIYEASPESEPPMSKPPVKAKGKGPAKAEPASAEATGW